MQIILDLESYSRLYKVLNDTRVILKDELEVLSGIDTGFWDDSDVGLSNEKRFFERVIESVKSRMSDFIYALSLLENVVEESDDDVVIDTNETIMSAIEAYSIPYEKE